MALAQHWHYIDLTLIYSRYVLISDNIIASRTPLQDSENMAELLDYFRKLTKVAFRFMFESTQSRLGNNLAMTVLTTENWFYFSPAARRPFLCARIIQGLGVYCVELWYIVINSIR